MEICFISQQAQSFGSALCKYALYKCTWQTQHIHMISLSHFFFFLSRSFFLHFFFPFRTSEPHFHPSPLANSVPTQSAVVVDWGDNLSKYQEEYDGKQRNLGPGSVLDPSWVHPGYPGSTPFQRHFHQGIEGFSLQTNFRSTPVTLILSVYCWGSMWANEHAWKVSNVDISSTWTIMENVRC